MSNHSNPWKTISSKLVYQNDWIKVREDQVIRPDGASGIYGVVDTRIAVGVVALTEDNHIYLIGQWRYPLNFYSWEIIEGGSDPGEDPLDTAKRELIEEAGLLADNWEQLGNEVFLSNCYSSEKALFFVARNLKETQNSPDGTEVLEKRKIKFEDALAMVDSGEISDAISVIAITRFARTFDR